MPGYAEDRPARRVADECKADIETYCTDVKPGRGRVISCLRAHSEKLAKSCAAAVQDVAEQAEAMKAAISFVQTECREDLDRYCKTVTPGEGRLLKCLDENAAGVSERCKAALKEVGLKE
jgi:phytoene/squalene synthetase